MKEAIELEDVEPVDEDSWPEDENQEHIDSDTRERCADMQAVFDA